MALFLSRAFVALLLPAMLGAQTSTVAPRAVRRDLPLGPQIRRAFAAGTRDSTGRPGPRYWQQSVSYDIDASLDTATNTLTGRETIVLHNTSPDSLMRIVLRLHQNYFRPEVARNDYVTDITEGMRIDRVVVNGTVVSVTDNARWHVDSSQSTVVSLLLDRAIAVGADARLEIAWRFRVPNVARGTRGERMGRWGTDLYQIAQWYPQIAMYDDLRGWATDSYLGVGEFYNQFGDFDMRLTVPAGYLIGSTGTLQNAEQVLPADVRQRLALAMRVDSTVHVVDSTSRGAGRATLGTPGSTLTWRFHASHVNDVAWMASRTVVWDATHANTPSPIAIHLLYEPSRPTYQQTAKTMRFALEWFASHMMPYAFPQATTVDGPETGMEYPMIIFSGPGTGVTVHELGHQWFPMMVGSNETWYGWMDEGLNNAVDEWANAELNHVARPSSTGQSYRSLAGSELEPPLMWPTDFAGPYANVASYTKPPLMLWALGGIVGDSAVRRAMSAYAKTWVFKHPSPWDFFFLMNRELGRDLSWFWNEWAFTTAACNQGIASVTRTPAGDRVRIVDRGDMVMPVILSAEFADKSARIVTVPVERWFGGARELTVTIPRSASRLASLTLDPDNRCQDVDRKDNSWSAASIH